MIIVLKGILLESVSLFNEMSPYLLFGFFFAGILHIYVSLDAVARHLGKSSFGSVIKAVIFGIPLPLCSCGVIPSAIMLKRKGASRGAVVSFLIATPITGVDSIFATYSLLGLVFAIFRVIASAITALVAGVLTNIFDFKHKSTEELTLGETCPHCENEPSPSESDETGVEKGSKIKELFSYAFIQLLGDIWKWLIIGILIAGIISYLIPDTFIQKYLGSSWQSMLVMLLIGIPMYVCSTGSIPIAASLLLKGMSPGAALVFLLAGPATNAVTITLVSKELGRRATIFYVMTIAVMSILMGMLLNLIWNHLGSVAPHILAHKMMLPEWIQRASSIILVCLILFNMIRKLHRHPPA